MVECFAVERKESRRTETGRRATASSTFPCRVSALHSETSVDSGEVWAAATATGTVLRLLSDSSWKRKGVSNESQVIARRGWFNGVLLVWEGTSESGEFERLYMYAHEDE